MVKHMKTHVVFLLIALFLVVGCGGDGVDVSFSTANIQDATLAKDEAGTQATTTFAPEDTFYLIVDLANAPDDTKVKADWTAVDVEGADPNTKLDDVELTSGSGTLTYDLSNDQLWPAGDYKVDIYLNEELDRTLEFQVAGPIMESEPEPTAETAEEPAAEPTEAAAEAPAGALTGIDNIRDAVVQIQAEGSFIHPEFGAVQNVAGSGTGFIIDPEGIAVTNNHVVTGAALVKVYLEGESEPRNAKILGVSECSDLAVIDIEGDGFPYLEWYSGDTNVGQDIYVAGFPLGDPEYTLTRGIISKAQADGETNWASVDSVLEYDATTNPGNSGGPVLTPDGEVLAVHYAGYAEARQAFGINSSVARDIVERLRAGEDVHSIGINGQAILTEEGLSGIWVSSVASGSPADQAGIQGGDILTTMEGLVLATDGTMADYCDILRSRDPEDVMSIEILRFATQEVLEGQLNGRELETSFSFAQELDDEVADQSGGSTAGYSQYTVVTDNSGLLEMEVPVEWSDTDGSAWTNDSGEQLGLSIAAAPSLEGFNTTWTTPGVSFRASDSLDLSEEEVLDVFDFSDVCAYDGREAYEDALYTGVYDVWSNCNDEGTVYLVLAATPESKEFVILVQVQIVSDADLDALDHILNSFIVQQ